MFHTLMICHESNIAHRSDARVEHLVLPGSAPTSQICSSGARRRMTASTNGDVALVRTRSPFARNTFRTRLGLAKRIRSAALRRGEARVRFFIRTRILALPHRQSTRAIDVGTELKGCFCFFICPSPVLEAPLSKLAGEPHGPCLVCDLVRVSRGGVRPVRV